MKAVNDYVVVQKLKVEPKKVAGMIMNEDVDEYNRYIKATVISTGHLVEAIKDKDVVYYDKHAGHGVQYKDILYHVIRARDVVLID